MHSLVIWVISIAVAAAFTVVGLWYGGAIFSGQEHVANASRIINDLNQIRAAGAMFQTQNGREIMEIDEFVPRYLRSLPAGWTLGEDDQNGYITFIAPEFSDEACMRINRSFGVPDNAGAPPTCPDVSDPNVLVFTGCCTTP